MSQEENKGYYREIITKAICGKGRKFAQTTHTITPPNKPTSILGCWIINHKYSAQKQKDRVVINGGYDVNIWYSYKNNTRTEVATDTVSYVDSVPLTYRDTNCINDNLEVIIRMIQEPNCLEATISPSGSKVIVQVEKECLTEVIGETKVAVYVNPDGEDEEWNQEAIDDEVEGFDEIDPDFLLNASDE